MRLSFEWDARKAASNRRKHGVSFEEAATAFDDDFSVTIPDPLHSWGEPRYLLLGMSNVVRILVVVHSERGDRIRLISARPAAPAEKRTYEKR